MASKSFNQWLNSLPILNWLALRPIGNSRVVRSSYFWVFFVPYCANLLKYAEPKIPLDILGHQIDLSLTLPFNWQLLFWAALAFGTGQLLYSWACPLLIKQYETFSAFKAEGQSRHELAKAVEVANEDDPVAARSTSIEKSCWEHLNKSYRQAGGHPYDSVFPIPEDQATVEAFHYAQQRAGEAAPIRRLICQVAYAIGFGLVAWMIANLIDTVVNYSVGQ